MHSLLCKSPLRGVVARRSVFNPRCGGFNPYRGGFTPPCSVFNPRRGGFNPYRGDFNPFHRIYAVLNAPEPDDDDYKGIPDYMDEFYGVDEDEDEDEGVDEDDASQFERNLTKKYYYLDPAVIHYHRSVFETLFHHTDAPLTGKELKALAEGHRLQLSIQHQEVYLKIHEERPEGLDDGVWEAIAELFNDWGVVQRLREILPTLLADPLVFQCQKEPLEIQLRVQHIPSQSQNDSKDVLF